MAASESYISDRYEKNASCANTKQWSFSHNPYRSAIVCAEITADALTCTASLFIAHQLWFQLGGHVAYSMRQVLSVGMVQGLLAVLLLKSSGAYSNSNSMMRIRESERSIRAAEQSVLLLLVMNFILRLHVSQTAIGMNLVLMPLLLMLQKQMTHSFAQLLHTKGVNCKRAVVYGTGEAARRITSTLLHSPKLGLRPVAMWSDGSMPLREGVSVMGYRRDQRSPAVLVRRDPMTPTLLRTLHCNLLIVATPDVSSAAMAHMTSIANQAGVAMAFVLHPATCTETCREAIDVDGLLLTSSAKLFPSRPYMLCKRLMDVLVSSLLLIALSPLLGVIALLIRLSSGGPALFVQERVGRENELFDMYKFRTMVSDAPRYATSPAHSNDPRITGIGRILRRMSLDELPQLINVFMGSMSLVGPRPEMPFIVATYNDYQRQRLQVKPGITGLWQLSADRAFPIHENIEYDLYYLRNRTLFMDIAVLVHTFVFAMGGGI